MSNVVKLTTKSVGRAAPEGTRFGLGPISLGSPAAAAPVESTVRTEVLAATPTPPAQSAVYDRTIRLPRPQMATQVSPIAATVVLQALGRETPAAPVTAPTRPPEAPDTRQITALLSAILVTLMALTGVAAALLARHG